MTEQEPNSARAVKQVKNPVKLRPLPLPNPLIDSNQRLEARVGIVRLGASMTVKVCLISLRIQHFCAGIAEDCFTMVC